MISFADFTDMVTREQLVDMEQLLRNADETLFCKALKDVHCLHHLLPELKTLPIQLRPANHIHKI